jgi:hypothetical protein
LLNVHRADSAKQEVAPLGHITDGKHDYFDTAPPTLSRQDEERTFLLGLGATDGHLSDMWIEYLRDIRGLSESDINDLKKKFWEQGGV